MRLVAGVGGHLARGLGGLYDAWNCKPVEMSLCPSKIPRWRPKNLSRLRRLIGIFPAWPLASNAWVSFPCGFHMWSARSSRCSRSAPLLELAASRSHSLSQLFRSNTPAFHQYEEVTKRFPSSEFDVLVVVEGDSLLQRNSLQKLGSLVQDLQLIKGTRGIISIFSAREPPVGGHIPPPLFPDTLPQEVRPMTPSSKR